jgi:Mg2+ and Co2+ transporter CorA
MDPAQNSSPRIPAVPPNAAPPINLQRGSLSFSPDVDPRRPSVTIDERTSQDDALDRPLINEVFSHQNGQAIMKFDDEEDFGSPSTMAVSASPAVSSAPPLPGGAMGGTAPPLAALGSAHPRRQRREQRAAETNRMRHAAFAHVTSRGGDRFMILQQEGSAAPVLRDFPSANALVAHLKALEGQFSALEHHASDDEEPNAHRLEKSLSRANLGATQRNFAPDSPRENDSSSETSSSSSASTMSGLAPERTLWIDIQSEDQDVIEEVLSHFPRLDRDTVDDLLQHDALDTAHWFHTHRYLFANIECALQNSANQSFSMPMQSQTFAGDASHASTTIVSLVAFSDVCITVHAKPFAGHRSTLQTLHGMTSRNNRQTVAGPAHPAGHGAAKPRAGHTHKRQRLTIGTIVATLIESVVVAMLPDPTACLSEVDRIDEMVLLVSKDSRDLLRRIARVRRVLSAARSSLFRKERFLQQFMSPIMKATFISGFNSEQYRHTLGELFHVVERLEAARDVLTQANSNFVSHISLQMSQVSNQMNKKMKALSQVATICLPLNIVTGLFGMNVQVPYQGDAYKTLAPFFVIVACMVAFLLVGIPLMWVTMHEDEKDRKSSEIQYDE